MSQDAKVNLEGHLKGRSQNELRAFSEIALKSGNSVLLSSILSVSPGLLDNPPLFLHEARLFFEVCRSGTPFSFDFLSKKRSVSSLEDSSLNSCLHLAAKAGNIQVFIIRSIFQTFAIAFTFSSVKPPLRSELSEPGFRNPAALGDSRRG